MGPTLNYSWEIIKIFLGLGVVVGLVYVLSHLIRNSRYYLGAQGSMIRVLDRGALTQHAQVYIVQVGEKYYLLGLTDDRITLLDTYDDLSFVQEAQAQVQLPKPLPGINFKELFKRSFGKKDGGDE